ncbi:hypothetical protein BGX27_003310, partial [Mortierella sp. AM989]
LISLNNLTAEEREKKLEELEDPTSEISEVFGTAPPKKTIHVIVQRPSAANLLFFALCLLSAAPLLLLRS